MPRSDLTDHLRSIVEDVTGSLPRASWRRMFGCDAVFVDGQIFGLIWKEGRIGVKLPDADRHAAMMALPGAAPWAPGKMVMSHWALVPEEFHDDTDELANWIREAYALAAAAGPKVRPGSSKLRSKKPARRAT